MEITTAACFFYIANETEGGFILLSTEFRRMGRVFSFGSSAP
jgi:hypothetical protein